MSLKQALILKDWLGDTFKAYGSYLQEGGDRYPYEGKKSGDWDSGSRLRVSKLGSTCPKLNAAYSTTQIEQPKKPFGTWMKMENGTRWAEVVYEAIAWGASTNSILTFKSEQRTIDHWSGLSGTIDGVLKLESGVDRVYAPVEVKRTDNDKFKGAGVRGLSYHQWLQTIGEMVLLSPNKDDYGYIKYGYTFTIYSPESDPPFRVWLTKWDEEKQGWYLYNTRISGEGSAWTNGDWPVDSNHSKNIFLSLEQFRSIVANYQDWLYKVKDDAFMYGRPYETMFDSWHCGKVIKPDYYKSNTKYGNIGDLKDGTGVITPKCPLFEYCYKYDIAQAGYTDSLPDTFKIEESIDNTLRLKPIHA